MSKDLLKSIRRGETLSRVEQSSLVMYLATPAMIAQISYIIMEYIDAAMVGSLGAHASAAIGLMATTIWLFGGLMSATAKGFCVQVAHAIGAREYDHSRAVLYSSLKICAIAGILLAIIGITISPYLPTWLGGNADVRDDASIYFLVVSASMPLFIMNFLLTGMLQCSGNMKVPSICNTLSCLLDILFNYYFIFTLNLGVLGAALGTVAAHIVSVSGMAWYLFFRSQEFNVRKYKAEDKPEGILRKAWQISLPLGIEHSVLCAAQIASTIIVAPLGTIVIAANAFGITIEALCYMPGHGVADAATTLVGQSLGAQRKPLARSFAFISVAIGMVIMTAMAVVMYIGSPYLMPLMSPDLDVQRLTVEALRIEAFAEPMFAANIVAYGVFVGAGDTKSPCWMNIISIWLVRIPLAAWWATEYGLKGVWVAMCIELCFRGFIFLIHLFRGKWLETKKILE